MARPEVEALREQFRLRDILSMKSVAEMREAIEQLAVTDPAPPEIQRERINASGVDAEWIRDSGVRLDGAILYLHGGGYIIGSVNSHRALIARIARAANVQAFGVDYRRAPEHPFPAPVEDATAAFRWLLANGFSAHQIAIAGDSAGGGLAIATLVAIRDAGFPLPACAVAMSPWTDLEALGESYIANRELDNLCHRQGILNLARLYLAGQNPRNPLAAPLYADLHRLPPVLIHVGEAETLLDDSTRIADRARAQGVEVDLKKWTDMPHVFQLFLPTIPESTQSIAEIGAFIATHLS
jgi:epsilon-lactone hydrolase